jgi:kinetochore protein Mis12/MTW1
VNRALQREQRRNEAILAQLRAVTESRSDTNHDPSLSFLFNSQAAQAFANQSQQPLTATTTFTMSQVPALKAVLTELRSKLLALRTSSIAIDTAKDERREERREYIEQRTKSHLERSGQTITDHVGAVGAQHIDPGEIEALEKVAETFHPS